MTQENRNLILAVVLSALVLFGWTFLSERFFPTPPPAATAPAAPAANGPIAPAAVPGAVPMAAPAGPQPVEKLVASGARVRIETPRLAGSINLNGAKFDDLVLKDHTVALPPSEPIRLFAPSGAKEAYFAGYGWVGAGAPPADAIFSANLHAYVGISILVLAIVRLCLRFVQGAPDAPDVEPPALRLLAKVTHGLLYLLFFAMPLSGVAAYYGGVEVAGFVHGGPMKLLMWILILAHIAGALVHQFYWKTDVLARMTRGVNRPASP